MKDSINKSPIQPKLLRMNNKSNKEHHPNSNIDINAKTFTTNITPKPNYIHNWNTRSKALQRIYIAIRKLGQINTVLNPDIGKLEEYGYF